MLKDVYMIQDINHIFKLNPQVFRYVVFVFLLLPHIFLVLDLFQKAHFHI